MRQYRAIIRPKIYYGCIVYRAATEAELKQVHSMLNEAFKISTGAFKFTPIANLQVLLNEPLLELRRQYLLLRYFYQVKCYLQNLAYLSIVNTRLEVFFISRNYVTAPIIIYHETSRGGGLDAPFIHLFICWSSIMAALLLCNHFTALCTLNGDISASAICYIWKFFLVHYLLGWPL